MNNEAKHLYAFMGGMVMVLMILSFTFFATLLIAGIKWSWGLI